MPVFLSHTSINKPETGRIFSYLTQRGIICYMDAIDPELKSTDDITAVLMNRIDWCTHMMAVISQYTQGSWWVPFEIGVASKSERRITTYKLKGPVTLPDFLTKWPILQDDYDLEQFVRMYKGDQTVSFSEGRATGATIGTAEQFHRSLKNAIGQR
jgi:hypothetical protein